ncbi:hypothetical protein [Methylobacterium aquaticum]|uniref:hypothetical protein n=1 Tax=Methylobacterium aquaticum TaxID=270351 RepID=UPI0019346119|nr:hypothetical protein [Methylobacterium aquaticum]QRE76988.1 hypothetical protein F1D61_28640 [Methylobacterium aquaticum]
MRLGHDRSLGARFVLRHSADTTMALWGRIAIAGVAAKKVIAKPLVSKKVSQKGYNVERIREALSKIPPPSKVEIGSAQEFKSSVRKFQEGAYTPLTEVRLMGDFGQKIAPTFGEAYKLLSSRLKSQRDRIMLYAMAANRENAARARDKNQSALTDKDIVELTIKVFDDKTIGVLEDHAFYTKPLAHQALECLMNGAHIIHNDGNEVLLRWGDWTPSDFKV